MGDLGELQSRLRKFRDDRDWEQFHTIKDLASALSIEASELVELMLWMRDEEVDKALENQEFRESFVDECADIFNYLLLIADKVGFDLVAKANTKISKNAEKYPVAKSYGKSTKYNRL
ncbi:nucleotide pyrophosphohydrolase [Thalassospira sp. ER-Se-21-Dark]|uniref:nucleotide pyrophosphohydrolase n=1 Tax=Thalassospira sp. ER-Se-21-Dark TaxID=2585190 RepID=UPI001B30E061|nr:nucleotide pyrophosphohydrolase [Thalassospira sp. ER-Se-21-Dark]MBP3125422.1 nucleotide pyrophosphohydrolase [Thalassospira sp. ER-Se-21-Dark]